MTSLLKLEGLRRPSGDATGMPGEVFLNSGCRSPGLSGPHHPSLRRKRREPLDKADFHTTSVAAWATPEGLRLAPAAQSMLRHPAPALAGREEAR